jgi:hypothetical protein
MPKSAKVWVESAFPDVTFCATTTTNTTKKGDTKMSDQNKLYKYIDTANNNAEVFCTYLATDSTGRWVMEPKGGGAPFSVDKTAVEEVVPYTISVAWLRTGDAEHYQTQADDGLKQGQIVVIGSELGVISKVNSKSKTSMYLNLDDIRIIPTISLAAHKAAHDKG